MPFLRPLREIMIGLTITGWLIYKIPISGAVRTTPVHLCFSLYVNSAFSPFVEEAKAKSRELDVGFLCV